MRKQINGSFLSTKFIEQIEAKLPAAKIATSDMLNLPNGLVLGKLGYLAQPIEDIHGLVPAYLKRVEAEEKWLETHHPEDENYVEKI